MPPEAAVIADRDPQPRSTEAADAAPRTPILGVGISAVTPASASAEIMGWIHEGKRHYVSVTSVHGLIESQDDPEFKRILNNSGLAVPDGMPLVWLSKWSGRRGVQRVTGRELMAALSQALAAEGRAAYYYGGAPGVAEELGQTLEGRFPGLRTAGVFSPPFRELTASEEAAIVEAINAVRPDVLWVGLSTPKQERWAAAIRNRLDVPAILCVGAAFDYLTGRITAAPQWMQRGGLEWLYRFGQEPRRLWRRYGRNNPLFAFYLLCDKLGLRNFNAD